MKIACPVDMDAGLDSRICGHFGSAPGFVLVDTSAWIHFLRPDGDGQAVFEGLLFQYVESRLVIMNPGRGDALVDAPTQQVEDGLAFCRRGPRVEEVGREVVVEILLTLLASMESTKVEVA